jgi:hypothetical protein
MKIGERAMENAEEVGAASVDYTMYSGYIVHRIYVGTDGKTGVGKNCRRKDSDGFYAAKVATARFYFTRILPRAGVHYAAALAGAETVMALE